ncbi:Uncharacterised protein [uncultured archaeon]|nr:Uncharacterised protein [uncultured archaeon]
MEVGKIHYIVRDDYNPLKRIRVNELSKLKCFTTVIRKIDDDIYDLSNLDRRGLIVAIIPIEDCIINSIEYGGHVFYCKGIILDYTNLFHPNYNANDLLHLINCQTNCRGTELTPNLLTRCCLRGNVKPDELWIAYYERI